MMRQRWGRSWIISRWCRHGRVSIAGNALTIRRRVHTEALAPNSVEDALITCLPGLEPILSLELQSMKIDHQSVTHGAKLNHASIETLFRCNLFLGSATNILIRCGKPFSAKGLAELRRKTAKIPWSEIVRGDKVRIEAKVTTSKSKLYHSGASQARVVAGFYEALGHTDIPDDYTALPLPSSIGENDPLVRLEVKIEKDEVEIWLCAATTPLHRRGYRLETCKAPLREDLAYALLYAAGWLPAWNALRLSCPYELLLDPLCGSGTIAIEGAGMLAGLAPGRLRPPPFEGTCYENSKLHSQLLAGSTRSARAVERAVIFASDRNRGAIAATKSNAERAQVLKYIDAEEHALSAQPLFSEKKGRPLLVVTNPPFGRRVSKPPKWRMNQRKSSDPLLPLYQSLLQLTLGRRDTRTVLLANGTDLCQRAGWKFDALFRSTLGGLSVTALRSKGKL